jgi:hypothetical protein
LSWSRFLEADELCDTCSQNQPSASTSSKIPNTYSPQNLGSINRDAEYDAESDENYSDSESNEAESLNDTFMAIESQIISVLGHDMGLAARLIPQIHAQLQFGSSSENTSCVGSEESSTAREPESDSLISSSITSRKSTSSHQKRNRDDGDQDDTEDGRGNDGFKKLRPRAEQNENTGLRFACPFHKRWPQKYCVSMTTGSKYRSCLGPGFLEARRLK